FSGRKAQDQIPGVGKLRDRKVQSEAPAESFLKPRLKRRHELPHPVLWRHHGRPLFSLRSETPAAEELRDERVAPLDLEHRKSRPHEDLARLGTIHSADEWSEK